MKDPSQNFRIKVLMLGPIPPLYGGMSIFMKNLLESKLIKVVNLKVLNTSVPAFFREYRSFRIFLTVWFTVQLIFRLIFFSPQIVHVHTNANVGFWEKSFFIELSKLFNKKIVVHIHGSEFQIFYEKTRYKKYIKKILDICDCVIALSKNWKDFFLSVGVKSKIEIIENGIHIKPFYKIDDVNDKIKILFVGLIGKRKGLYTILESMKNSKLLKSELVEFYFLGEGLTRSEFHDVINAYKRENLINTHFLGTLIGERKYEFFRKCDIFILPSFAEGLPIAILEAMASELPVISTKVGGIPDLVSRENGILIEPGDAKGLTKALEILIKDNKLREIMGVNNRKKIIKNYSVSIMVDKIIKLYKYII